MPRVQGRVMDDEGNFNPDMIREVFNGRDWKWQRRVGAFFFSWETWEPFAILPGIEIWHRADGYEPTLLVFRWLGFSLDITLRNAKSFES